MTAPDPGQFSSMVRLINRSLANLELAYEEVHALAYTTMNGDGVKTKIVGADPVGELATDHSVDVFRAELERAFGGILVAAEGADRARQALRRGLQTASAETVVSRGKVTTWTEADLAEAEARAFARRRARYA